MGRNLQAARRVRPLPLVYFHGMPGGPGEWAVNAQPALRESAWLADRNDPAETVEAIAARLAAAFPRGVRLIGFSAGAFAALRTAALLGDKAAALDLVSPAAPLQLGNFLPDMAGGPIFRMAARQPGLFATVARAQGSLARHFPGFLLGRLLATAQGGDAELARDPGFRQRMAAVLRDGLGRDFRGFETEVLAYVADWRDVLGQVSGEVTIWQGNRDNWTPPAMGRALHAAMPGSRLELLPGASHYSALRAALARIG